MIFTSVGISGGAGSDGMDRIVPDTPIAKGSRNAWVYVIMTVQQAAGPPSSPRRLADRNRWPNTRFGPLRKARPPAWVGVSEGHSVETIQRRTHRGAARLLDEDAVAIATEPAAYLRGQVDGSNTGDSAALASVPTPRQCSSRPTSTSPPGAAAFTSDAWVAPASLSHGGSDAREGLRGISRSDVRSGGVTVAITFERASCRGEEPTWT
ncbi:hypothetical protein GCM10022215_38690 [Nocardioides fonticola]|uniref:Uncharacterized protein n=1 Tax=Nocardioides fonticola TaxID=450363 RepID=A0ABP7XY37_9ACTN